MNQLDILKTALSTGFAMFTYTKVSDNTTRLAVGTTNPELTHLFVQPKESNGSKRKSNNTNVHYFDLSRMAPRQFREDNLIKIIAVEMPIASACRMALAISFDASSVTLTEHERTRELVKAVLHPDTYDDIEDEICNECYSDADDLQEILCHFEDHKDFDYERFGGTSFVDRNAWWCMRHNGGYGLNGVSLAAGGIVSSGFDCFGNPTHGHRVGTTLGGLRATALVDTKITFSPDAEMSVEPKAAEMVDIAKVAEATKVVEPIKVATKAATASICDDNFFKFYRMELVKSLLSGAYVVGQSYQDARVDAAFEMADKVIARLKAEE